ncbi:hypothetical protein [uncultured Variovorax sp.]|uniref:hypothetical protein n=1 Tax=uncultured Variovorax sp. TaxID=114708 RepID=UPI0025CBEA2B|nr:hypothetical protein [uncultured Variovorax sp.]
MTSKHEPTRRKALQLAAGALAMASSPAPVIARLQLEGEFAGPSANVLWKPVDDAWRFAESSDELVDIGPVQ